LKIGALPTMPLNTWGAELTGEKATPVPHKAPFFLCFWQEAAPRPANVAVPM
jgi:hypothetical protein